MVSLEVVYKYLKRIMDIVLSVIGLIITIPLIVILGICIKWETKGPCFYSQERIGENGKSFIMYKLRSMPLDAEAHGPQWAQEHDSRVTKVGKFTRRTRLDEIPQFFNILKGDMSIVGPRPEREYFVCKFSEEMPEYVQRLQVRPGLTGWAQVNGGYKLTPREKLEMDLYYIRNQSIWLDIKIILKTIAIIFNGNGAR